MKKILILILSISLGTKAFGMDWLNPYSYFGGGKPTAEEALKFKFDEKSKEAFADFLSLMVNTGKTLPDAGSNHAVQVYKRMQEEGFDGLVKMPKFETSFNTYLTRLEKNPDFKKAKHDHSKEEWIKVCFYVERELQMAGVKFPAEHSAKKFLELNAHLPVTSDMALMAGALLQLVPGQLQREEKQKQAE